MFGKVRFGLSLVGLFAVWSAFHAYTLVKFGYGISYSLVDSLVSNSLLAAGSFFLSLMLFYYRPGNRRYDLIIAWSGAMAVLVVFLSVHALMYLFRSEPELGLVLERTGAVRLGIAFLFINCCAIVSTVWYNQLDDSRQTARKQETERLRNEAELFRLHQQLQPHFIFNSLNSITALISTRPGEARRMVYLLSDFLRGTLRQEKELTSFNLEIDHLKLYLEIEKVRFGHRLETVFYLPENSLSALVPAMILQPVLENALKFGLYGTSEAVVISLQARMESGTLEIMVSNPYDKACQTKGKGTGFGLESISRRLYLIYGRTDLVGTSQTEIFFTVNLQIPQSTPADNLTITR